MRRFRRAFAAFCLTLVWPLGGQADERCAPWPGEPSPLPAVGDRDPIRARWADLRAEQIAELAEATAARDRVEAHRLWQRVLCLDPIHPAARDAIAKTRPEVVVTARRAAAALRAPVVAKRRPAPPREEPDPREREIDAALARAQQEIDAARFDAALATLRAVEPKLDAAPARARRGRRVRYEVLRATTLAAYGDEAGARQSFERALALEPALALDPASASPKLRRSLDAARGAASP